MPENLALTSLARVIAIALAALVSVTAAATAREADADDQPVQELFVGETVFVQDHGEVQLTSGFDVRKTADSKSWTASQVMQYGLTDRLELDAEVPFVSGLGTTAVRAAGIGDIEVGALLGVARNIRAGALSLGARVRLPTGNENKGHGDGQTVPEAVAIFGRSLGRVQIHASGEVGFANKGTPKEWTYGAGVMMTTGRLRETLELDALHEGEEDRVLMTPGLYLKPRAAFEVGVGVPVGLTARSADVGVVVLATVEFGGR
jgi:hypothetical protein